ncbi:cation:proton antiporter [Halobacteriales archaeon QH_2_65_14]|nr:MAG: cation:proton antiporter [Halobacteriales archaeon QH_2_65_14]
MTPFEAALFVFVLATALTTAFLRDVLGVIVVFAAYSLGMALFYAFLLAPDVAMTEAAIGAGVTTLLLLLTLVKTVRETEGPRFERPNLPALLIMGGLLVALVLTIGDFPALGEAFDSKGWVWRNPAVTQYYIENAYEDTGVTNAVTAVLAGYRGFDTFGEAVVVFSAGIASLLVLKREVFTRE